MSLESKLVLAEFLDSETSWVLAGAKRRRETQPEDDDGASRLVGMPERESLGPKLVGSRFRSRSCGDSPEPVKANPAGLQGAAAPRGECWQRGVRLHGRRSHVLPECQAAEAAASPLATPRLPLPCGTPAALRSGPSQCRACRPTAPARSPIGSPADIQCAAQSPASDAARHTSGRSLPAADVLALPAPPGTKTAPAPSPAPAAAPSPTQSPESAPTAPAARDETPPPCPACSCIPVKPS